MQWAPTSPGHSCGSALTQRVHAQPPHGQVAFVLLTGRRSALVFLSKVGYIAKHDALCLAQNIGMDTSKDKQDLSTPVTETPAPAASVAVSHTASAAEQPADELADSTAQPGVSPAGHAASPCERLDSTTPCPSATAAARASQPSSRPSEVVDLTADDVQSVQQSKSTGVECAPYPSACYISSDNRRPVLGRQTCVTCGISHSLPDGLVQVQHRQLARPASPGSLRPPQQRSLRQPTGWLSCGRSKRTLRHYSSRSGRRLRSRSFLQLVQRSDPSTELMCAAAADGMASMAWDPSLLTTLIRECSTALQRCCTDARRCCRA